MGRPLFNFEAFALATLALETARGAVIALSVDSDGARAAAVALSANSLGRGTSLERRGLATSLR